MVLSVLGIVSGAIVPAGTAAAAANPDRGNPATMHPSHISPAYPPSSDKHTVECESEPPPPRATGSKVCVPGPSTEINHGYSLAEVKSGTARSALWVDGNSDAPRGGHVFALVPAPRTGIWYPKDGFLKTTGGDKAWCLLYPARHKVQFIGDGTGARRQVRCTVKFRVAFIDPGDKVTAVVITYRQPLYHDRLLRTVAIVARFHARWAWIGGVDWPKSKPPKALAGPSPAL